MAYGLYVSTTYGRFHKSEYFIVVHHRSRTRTKTAGNTISTV